MKFKLGFKSTVLPLLLLIALAIITVFIQFTSEENNTAINSYVPQKADFILKLETKKILNESLISFLFESKDDQVFSKMNEKLISSENKDFELGIDLLGESFVFTIPFKKTHLKGICLELKNKKEFKKNIQKLLSENQFFTVKDNRGYVVSYGDDYSKQEVQIFIEKEINLSNDHVKNIQFYQDEQKNLIQLKTRGDIWGDQTIFSESNIKLNIKQREMTLNGDLEYSNKQSETCFTTHFKTQKSKNNFQFNTSIIPRQIQDTLSFYLNKVNLNPPLISGISFNYSGIEMTSSKFLPTMDLILQFEKPYSIVNIISNTDFLSSLEADTKGNIISIEGKKYYLKQLDAQTILISTNKDVEIVKTKTDELLEINGNMLSIFEFKNGGVFKSLLNGISIYKAPKEFFNNCEHVHLKLLKSKNNCKLEGLIKFKENRYAMNELTKLFLELQVILF